jgi:hypothetical protein
MFTLWMNPKALHISLSKTWRIPPSCNFNGECDEQNREGGRIVPTFSDKPKSLYIDSDSDVSLSEMRGTVPPNFMPYHQSDYEMKTACNISYIH